jgi:membrane protein YdbS with pleckstrin-like domain
VALVAVVIVALAAPVGRFGPWFLALGWFVLCLGLGAFALLWPPVRYRYTSYRVSEGGVRIRRGVVWRLAISVPRSRVQHTDVSQGPIERAFDLATLIIYTAGTQHASVHLSGLAHETALTIRDHLIGSVDDDAV